MTNNKEIKELIKEKELIDKKISALMVDESFSLAFEKYNINYNLIKHMDINDVVVITYIAHGGYYHVIVIDGFGKVSIGNAEKVRMGNLIHYLEKNTLNIRRVINVTRLNNPAN